MAQTGPGALVNVEGLASLQRAFGRADKELKTEMRKALKEVAEPVRADVERLAVSEIRRIGPKWYRMRIGVTRKLVYVAPKERGVKRKGWDPAKRPNLATLLRERAMDPAEAQNQATLLKAVDEVLATVGKTWEKTR
jgi:hypothetical protein